MGLPPFPPPHTLGAIERVKNTDFKQTLLLWNQIIYKRDIDSVMMRVLCKGRESAYGVCCVGVFSVFSAVRCLSMYTAHHIGHVCVQALVKTSVQCRLGRQRMEYGVFVFVYKYNNEGE